MNESLNIDELRALIDIAAPTPTFHYLVCHPSVIMHLKLLQQRLESLASDHCMKSPIYSSGIEILSHPKILKNHSIACETREELEKILELLDTTV